MKRVCLVANAGLSGNPDGATATTNLALALDTRGYQVTLLDTDGRQSNESSTAPRRTGITIDHLRNPAVVIPDYLRDSHLVYEHLKGQDFDAIVFPDWLGSAFASVSAKRAGLTFDSSQLVIVTHGPTEWAREADQEMKLTERDLATAHMERSALEGADMVVGPSAHLHQWMLDRGWQLGPRRAPVPYVTAVGLEQLGGLPQRPGWRDRSASPERTRELIFFGPLEHRSGVLPYTRALNLVEPRLLSGVTLSFLGPEVTYTTADVRRMLDPAVRSVTDLRFATETEEALVYLEQPGRVTVIPSLEANSPSRVYDCLEAGICFIAADVGGIPELIHEADRARCLFSLRPAALAQFLTRILSSEAHVSPPRPAFSPSTSMAAWEDILGTPGSVPARPAADPLVSIIVPHHDRPELVKLTLESLEVQSHPRIEIVLVDDGSASTEARAALQHFENREWRHPLRVTRQENRFPGAARNTGVREARGDLLVFIDDDDVAQPDYVSAMATAIERTRADAVTCAFRIFEDREGPPRSAVRTQAFLGGSLPLALMGNHLGGAGVIMRRAAWETVGGYHETPDLGLEDWDILTRMLMAGLSVVTIPEALYWYRNRPDGVNASTDRYRSHQMILERFREALPPALRLLADLVHGQALALEEDPERRALRKDLDLRERYQWLLERRIEMLQADLRALAGH